jgi:hypothetical protein
MFLSIMSKCKSRLNNAITFLNILNIDLMVYHIIIYILLMLRNIFVLLFILIIKNIFCARLKNLFVQILKMPYYNGFHPNFNDSNIIIIKKY